MAKPPVDAFVDLDTETCVRLQEFHDRLERMNLFEILGADPDDDLGALRRAYFRRSKQFHPDRFYSRRLGPYKAVLERTFQWCAAAFKFLKDEARREEYRTRVLGNASRSSARVVPHGQGASLEFIIQDDEQDPATPPWLTRRLRTRVPDQDDALEFIVEERTPSAAALQRSLLAKGIDFLVDD